MDEILHWLTGYTEKEVEALIETSVNYATFFRNAPALNENRHFNKGAICGVKVEDIIEPLMQEIRYFDKLVDELAKGKPLSIILRA